MNDSLDRGKNRLFILLPIQVRGGASYGNASRVALACEILLSLGWVPRGVGVALTKKKKLEDLSSLDYGTHAFFQEANYCTS